MIHLAAGVRRGAPVLARVRRSTQQAPGSRLPTGVQRAPYSARVDANAWQAPALARSQLGGARWVPDSASAWARHLQHAPLPPDPATLGTLAGALLPAPDSAHARARHLLQAPLSLDPATLDALAGVLQLAQSSAPALGSAASNMQLASGAANAVTSIASAGLTYLAQHLPVASTGAFDLTPLTSVQTPSGAPRVPGPMQTSPAQAPLVTPASIGGYDSQNSTSWLAGDSAPAAVGGAGDRVSVASAASSGGGGGSPKVATVLVALLPVSCFVLLGATGDTQPAANCKSMTLNCMTSLL